MISSMKTPVCAAAVIGLGGCGFFWSVDEKTCHNPRNDFLSASGSMVTDVLTLLTVIIIGSAVLLA